MASKPLMLLPAVLILANTQGVIFGNQDQERPKPDEAKPPAAIRQKSPVKQKSDPASAEDEAYSTERMLRERALFILDGITASKEIQEELPAAHLKAEIAALMCASGDKARAMPILRTSLTAIADHLFSQKPTVEAQSLVTRAQNGVTPEAQDRSNSFEAIALAVQISDTACQCDESARAWFLNEFERLRSADAQKRENGDRERSQVLEETWGTRPPAEREISSELLARAAHERLAAGRVDEALQLLTKSLAYAVTFPSVTAILRLVNQRPDVAEKLFIEAAKRVRAVPSGVEVGALHFGLNDLLRAVGGERVPVTYLDAVTALLTAPGSSEVAKSPDMLRLIKESLPMYTSFRPEVRPQVELFIAEATRRLNPELREALQKPFAAQSLEQQVSTLEEIASKSPLESERDQANASIASLYLHRERFEPASRAISRIVDVNLKSELLDELTYQRVLSQASKPQDRFLVFQEIQNVSSLTMRVRLYTEFGGANRERDPVIARMALDEAARLANQKLDPSPVRSHLLFTLSRLYAEFDSLRAFEVLGDAIKSVNKHREQPASRWGRAQPDVTVVRYDRTWRFPRRVVADPLRYKEPYDMSTFRKLAINDFDRVLWDATAIEDKLLSATAKYEACSAVFLDLKPAEAKPSPDRKATKQPGDR